MKKKFLCSCLALALGAGAGYTLVSFAQVKPETLVKQRQAAMTLQGKYWYRYLRPTGQGKMPYDAAAVARYVGYMDTLSQVPWDGFDASTKDVKSAAAAAVFADAVKFKQEQDHYRAEVVKLVAATKGGDEAAVKAQILAVNKSCDGCHDSFRERQ